MLACFFFFKQKTAYEMRISDWSSDVCSSDLDDRCRGRRARPRPQSPRATLTARHGAAQPKRTGPPLADAPPKSLHCTVVSAELSAPEEQIGRASCRERVCQYV